MPRTSTSRPTECLYATTVCSTLIGFRIDAANGFLAPIGRWSTETTPRGFAIDPRGRFLLATGLDSNQLSVHAINPEQGGLTLRGQYPVGGMPNWVGYLSISPDSGANQSFRAPAETVSNLSRRR